MAADQRQFLHFQNRFRGLISAYKSKRFLKDRRVAKSKRFKAGLSELFLDMRAGLSHEQYRPMLKWIFNQKSGQLHDLQQSSDLYEELAGVYMRAASVSLEDEIRWISERLKIESNSISDFLSVASAIEQLTVLGEYEQAIEAMSRLQKSFGVSLWSVQARLALEHLAGGLERQKIYAAEVRAVYKQGLLGFVTYHTSVRNEDRTTFTKFLEDIEQRIDQQPHYDTAIRAYARYRLKDEYPASDAGLASILRVEQSHSVFDIYQTLIAVLQKIASRGCDEELAKVIVASLEDLRVSDFRLIKILCALDSSISASSLPDRDHKISNALFTGNVVQAAIVAKRCDGFATDPWSVIYAGFAYSHGRRLCNAAFPKPTTLAQSIGHIQSRCRGADDAWDQLTKLALNLRGLPITAGILEFLRQMRRAYPTEAWRPDTIGLNSPTTGIEDLQKSQLVADVEGSPTADPTTKVWLKWHYPCHGGTYGDDKVLALANSLGLLREGDFDGAVSSLLQPVLRWPEPLGALRALALLHCHHTRGNRQGVIELIADEGAKSEANDYFLPLVSALEDLDWSSYKLADPLAAAVALHLLWKRNASVSTASVLRFATGAFLRSTHSRLPSLLWESGDSYISHQFIYFLRNVCVPNILDLSRVVQGSRRILEERQAICATLLEIDPENSEDYEQEIYLISNQLALDEGKRIVDSTRIRVDTDALTLWAKRELSEDYARYRDLVEVKVPSVQTFDDVLRELMDGNPGQRALFTPNTEADAILVSLLKRLGSEFLSNPTFGLDFNLSKRVRHQSFIGLIRGPLEFAQLTTTRESEEGEYHRNDYWIEKLAGSDEATKTEIDGALRQFSTRFDEALTEAKDKYFHIKSEEKPDGMVVLTITNRMISVARAIMSLDLKFEEFLQAAITLLWFALDSSLAQIRAFIGESIKRELINGFDELRAQIRGRVGENASLPEFDNAVGEASAEVQVKLDEASLWFNHPQQGSEKALFTLDQALKIAIETAQKSHRGFSPTVSQYVDGDVFLQASNLIFVHDVVFVAMGNAHKHSGLKNPNIDVRAICNTQLSTLTIEVVSDSRPSHRVANERSMAPIRKLIKSGKLGPRTRAEGGTGFLKLAAVAGQSGRGNIHFGYSEDGRFELKVTYALNISKEPLPDAS